MNFLLKKIYAKLRKEQNILITYATILAYNFYVS
jgi:hypothetical protein